MMRMCCTGEFFKIQHNQRRICQRFRHDAFGIGLERLADRIVIRIRVYDSTGYAHFFMVTASRLKVPPYTVDDNTTWSPASQILKTA